ncbi:MAG: thiamine pyrophosphate-requiring protein, partial [Chloroflexota bacterium]|nr:thiamine pyrophosphate-requiring protein [Chloroflexota bacterium]
MNGYGAISKILKKEGVEWIACFPNNPLIEAVAKEGIRPIMFRQERGGIMAADGYSRTMMGEKFGVFACQGGPGAENSYGGIAQAFADSVPIMFIPDGIPLYNSDVSPSFISSKNFIDITKWSKSINDSDRIVPLMKRAFHSLKNGRPSPVLLEMHRDHMTQDVNNLEDYKSPNQSKFFPTDDFIDSAVKLLINSKNPIIWSGQGVLYSSATEELKELSSLLSLPVITTMPGKSSFDERNPLSLGSANRTAPKTVWKYLGISDTVFAIGSSLTITNYGITIPNGKKIIHSTNNYEDINKDYDVEIPLLGDSKLVLQKMIECIKSNYKDHISSDEQRETIKEEIKKVKDEWSKEWDNLLNSDMNPINPYRIVNEINKNIDHENTIVTHDAGHPRDQMMPFITATNPGSYIGWGKSTHLGYGIPLMIGAKIAKPEKFCINFMGDGAFGMSGLDIETSQRSGSPITTIVMNNGTMGGYPQNYPQSIEKFQTIKMTGNYAKIAEGMGAKGISVDNPNEIKKAILDARKFNDDGFSVLIDIKTQPELKMSNY